MKKLICYIKGHIWKPWYHTMENTRVDQCSRCKKTREVEQ